MDLILNQSQAEAVYSAMRALEQAGVTRFSGFIPGKDGAGRSTSTEVSRIYGGNIIVEIAGYNLDRREHYADQAAFATAYGLGDDAEPEQTPAPDPAIPCGDGCNYMADPQPDNKYQSKCTRCGSTIPF